MSRRRCDVTPVVVVCLAGLFSLALMVSQVALTLAPASDRVSGVPVRYIPGAPPRMIQDD